MKKIVGGFSICILLLLSNTMNAQRVAISATASAPDASAILDVKSSTLGMLIPRMTSSQRIAIGSPAQGLMVYDNVTNSFWFYTGLAWTELTAGATTNYWSASGANISANNSGKIGIGTSAPQTKLHINDQTSATTFTGINNVGLRIQGFNSPGNYALLGFGGYGPSYTNNLAQIGANFTNSGSSLLFGTSNNYTTGITNTAMTIDYNGNVGIGTTTPASKLHVINILGRGIHATGATEGIYGQGTGTNGIGVTGIGYEYGLYGNGGSYGVYGQGDINGIYGQGFVAVLGKSSLSGGNGVRGEATGANAYGVSGISSSSVGVYGQGETEGIHGVGQIAVLGSGVEIGVKGTSSITLGKGIFGYSTGLYGVGVSGVGTDENSVGVSGLGGEIGVIGRADNIGVKGTNEGGITGIGVLGEASAIFGIGVYGSSSSHYGIYGVTGNISSYAGYFSGSVYSTGIYLSSDRTLKQDISEVTNAMGLIKKLQPKSYTYRQDGNYKLMNLPQGNHYGLIAQDVEQILPNLVKATTFETRNAAMTAKQEQGATSKRPSASPTSETIAFKAVNYMELIPIMIKAMQEQEDKIQKQDAKIEALTLLVNKLSQKQ